MMEAGVWNPNRATHHDNHMSGWEKKKKKSLQPGRTVFRLTRSDGSFTWRQDVSQGAGEEMKANFYCMCGRKKVLKGSVGLLCRTAALKDKTQQHFSLRRRRDYETKDPVL